MRFLLGFVFVMNIFAADALPEGGGSIAEVLRGRGVSSITYLETAYKEYISAANLVLASQAQDRAPDPAGNKALETKEREVELLLGRFQMEVLLRCSNRQLMLTAAQIKKYNEYVALIKGQLACVKKNRARARSPMAARSIFLKTD